ncbi:ribonuclease-III-like-domain-containing protein [Boeremia exigua]|uniref:ribonuclease-III-like-domain-containing protein n=1 Tax=Boeremia exigua TaxID=749465 RepID=UPI001E8D58AE|nr:ribonuclease-III-like-domain-containing protein [Boeremia exigua]KAH6638948.1 ribonuclease-III-like-domain-containing protein [Boeremia exigua]
MASTRATRRLLASAAPSLRCSRASPPALARPAACAFSTTPPSRAPEYDSEAAARPRWQQTPPRMQAPFRIRPAAKGGVFKVNEDPKRLDDAYVRLLGPGGDKLLDDEVKWLAVTHKSFDHGRRGFNDRLAFLGRRIVELQTSQALISSPQAKPWPRDAAGEPKRDHFGRRPFLHPALNGLAGLSNEAEAAVLDKARLAQLAERYGLDKVTRWTPKRADNPHASGQESVLMTSLYAIVGAVAMERGGEEANRLVQNKILTPLGFAFSSEA